MKTRTSNLKELYGAFAAIAVALTTAATSFAATGHSYTTGPAEVVPPNDAVFGMTYGDWGAAWQQWFQSIPVEDNPIVDDVGDKCNEGQASGPVFFLVGTYTDEIPETPEVSEAERDCEIPANKYLFFPIVNVGADTLPGDFAAPTEAAQRQLAAFFADRIDVGTLSVTIDGKKVKNLVDFRAQSPAYDFSLPENNIFGAEPGSYSGVTDGYWLMLKPLSPGEHQVRFKGAIVSDGTPLPDPDGTIIPAGEIIFALDVTYNLTVE